MKRRIFAWGFVLVWVMTIFSLSSEPAPQSSEKSKQVLDRVEAAIEVVDHRFESIEINRWNRSELHRMVRKNAHVFVYFILTFGLLVALHVTNIGGKRKYATAWAVATVVAILDETYQNFIPGRSGEVMDVLIDSIGILLALLIHYLMRRLYKKVVPKVKNRIIYEQKK